MCRLNKKFEKLALFLSLIALVVSLAIVCVWIFSVDELSVVNSDTFMSAIIGVLGVLFTILMGWNIYSVIDVRQYKEEMNKTLEEIKKKTEEMNKKEKEYERKFKSQDDLSAAYTFYGLGEFYFGQKRYVNSYLKYTSSALYFKKAEEHGYAFHSLERINLLLRTIRRDLKENHGSYVLDFDIYDYLSYRKDLAELQMINFKEYLDMKNHETFMNYITRYSKHIKIEDTDFTLYSYNADIKQRPIAIYLLMKDNEYICKTMLYDEYCGVLQYNLDLNHNIVAVAEFISLEECKMVYDKIDAPIVVKGNERK